VSGATSADAGEGREAGCRNDGGAWSGAGYARARHGGGTGRTWKTVGAAAGANGYDRECSPPRRVSAWGIVASVDPGFGDEETLVVGTGTEPFSRSASRRDGGRGIGSSSSVGKDRRFRGANSSSRCGDSSAGRGARTRGRCVADRGMGSRTIVCPGSGLARPKSSASGGRSDDACGSSC
jgi:hypothetical protein